MIRTDELRGIIAKNNYSQARVAEEIGITPKTFYEKMNRGVFGSDEIEAMIRFLHIENPMDIFFAREQLYKIHKKARWEAMNDLKEIKEKLAAIESLLQRLPEIQAAVFLLMRDEYETAKAQGRDARQLWAVPNPDQR